MSAGKNRQSRRTHRYESHRCQPHRHQAHRYQTYQFPLHAAVISAAARADVRCAQHGPLGLRHFIGAAPGCLVTPGSGGSAETQGVWTR